MKIDRSTRRAPYSPVDTNDDCLFPDPFTVKSIQLLDDTLGSREDDFWKEAGLPKFRDEPYSPLEAMANVLIGIKPILRSPLADKDDERVAWLYDRVARQLGVPPSGSYPRIRL